MELEESGGVEQLKEQCESCGAALTTEELAAILDGTSERFLCGRCAAEQLPDEDFDEEL